MSKKPTGQPRKKGGANKPVPSEINRTSREKRPSAKAGQPAKKKSLPPKPQRPQKPQKSHKTQRPPQSQTADTARKRNALNLDSSGGYSGAYQDLLDKDAENLLKKNRQQQETSHLYLKPLPAAKAPSSPYKRKVKRVLFYIATIAVLVSVCVVLSLTVFFKIDEISVEGDTRYAGEEIIASCMIERGDNLILCNTGPGEKEIWKKFPYIEKVTIHKKLFNRIVIEVKEATPTSVIESEGKYVLLSESGKIIDISDRKQNDVPIIMGAKLKNPKLSSSIHYKDANVEEFINEILDAAERYGFGVLKTIDITNLSKIALETKQGLHIILGMPQSIDHKMKTAMRIMEKSVPKGDVGTLDVSLSAAEGGKSYFSSRKPGVTESSGAESSVSEQSSRKPETSETSQTESTEASEESDIWDTSDSGSQNSESGSDNGDIWYNDNYNDDDNAWTGGDDYVWTPEE